ncbi:MAG: tetratricopeptide repeat protein [bacterium]|nr:tetratricopeptide repeat protein [bacterium]
MSTLEYINLAILLHNLANLYQTQGRYGNAEPLFKRSFTINEKALGPDHPKVATSFGDLALEAQEKRLSKRLHCRSRRPLH